MFDLVKIEQYKYNYVFILSKNGIVLIKYLNYLIDSNMFKYKTTNGEQYMVVLYLLQNIFKMVNYKF